MDLTIVKPSDIAQVAILQDKLREAHEKIAHLEVLLKSSNIQSIGDEVTDEETICRTQLRVLANKTTNGTELKFEEVKKAETLHNMLLKIESLRKKKSNNTDNLSDEELTRAINGPV